MNGADRYRTLTGRDPESTDGPDLGAREGLDPVTGLPVLIYDFDGEPLATPGDIDSEYIPRILWSGVAKGRSRLVVALSPGWQRYSEESPPLTLEQLLEAAEAVRSAAAAGVPHGDIAPWRLLLVGDRLQVEGFGVPWRPQPGRYKAPEVSDSGTVAGDLWSLAAVARELGLTIEDETVMAVLEQCLAEDPLERPSAEEFYLALESLAAGGAGTLGSAGAGESPGGASARSSDEPRGAPAGAAPADASANDEPEHRPVGPQGTSTRGTAGAPPADQTEHRSGDSRGTPLSGPAASTLSSKKSDHHAGDPIDAFARSLADHRSSSRSELTSEKWGVTDSAGGRGKGPIATKPSKPLPPPEPSEEPGERRRRLTLLGALMAAVVILALLALYGPDGSAPQRPTPLEDVVYVVEVEVAPDDLPPVMIHLVGAPQGSSLARSDTIGTAPRHLALDRPGTWAFQGSLQGRRSEVVEIEVPDERTVTLVMPQ